MGVVIILIVVVFFVYIRFKYFLDKNERSEPTLEQLTSNQRQILERYFDYYNNLPDNTQKRLFEHRVTRFIQLKTFVPQQGIPQITDEMKVLVAASAMQLAFGFKDVYYEHFTKIILYPAEIYGKYTKQWYEGKVKLDGRIFLSWKNFVNGYKFPEDGRNLGLHEMAHALFFENAIMNSCYDFIDRNALNKFALLAKKEILAMKNGESAFFRPYASQNRHEFFAVSVEYFFEKPVAFLEAKPDLYNTLVKLLKQDPSYRKIQH
ncbi:MAG: DgsA anti-repressor MtfA [Bacteroidetes bacterium HGW-Bacteroidetes-21]|jgi:hypothetical protein|nr:MAG: DgsA anti-repressor MtfA [Bacteroidetes bacterium HGW-Bacteroidetes-21]